MAKQTINIGTIANDGTGDPLRTAFDKANDNFDELYVDKHTHSNKAVLDATTASFTTADETKLDGIEAGADVTDAANVAAAGAVMLTGNQTVAGIKTFSSSPIVPAPTTDLQAATKKYVDDAVTAGGGYTNEMAQDAVGGIMEVGHFDYNDTTPSIKLATAILDSLALADTALQSGDVDTTTLAAGVLDTDLSSVAGTDTTIPSAKATKAALDLKADKNAMPVTLTIACSDETTALTTGTAKVTFRMPHAMTLTAVRASVTTAPTGGTLLTVDINEAGVSVLSTKLTFDASEKTTNTATTAAVISDSSLADDAEITIDIDAVGSTVAGAGLKVTLIGTRAI